MAPKSQLPAPGIAACPSAPHRSVLGLLRAATGRPGGPGLVADLGASDPQEIVPIATFNYVHVAMAAGFETSPDLQRAVPDDLVIFFKEMEQANIRRNAAIRAQIAEIGGILAENGIRSVALKGAAELAAPVFPRPGLRFLSDVDLLVPEDDITRAAGILHGTGARSDRVDAEAERHHHHIAPLRRRDWPVMLELHRGLGTVGGQAFVAAEAVLDRALPSDLPGIAVPAPEHRLAHCVFHAQLHRPRYRDGQLSLRDILEFEVMLRAFGAEPVALARALFADSFDPASWEALDAARALVFGNESDIAALGRSPRAWAETALVDFGRPRRRRRTELLRLAGTYAKDLLSDPARRRHYLGELFRRGRLRRFLALHRDRFRRTR